MATIVTRFLRKFRAPALPASPLEYIRTDEDQFRNILRLYFNQIDSAFGGLLDTTGGKYVNFPYGAFSSNADQTATINTATLMTLNTTDFSNQVSMGTVAVPSNSKITVANAGIYTAFQDVYIWLRQNGVDIPGSTGFVSIPNRHAGTDGHTIVGWNYFLSMAENDYIEIYWSIPNAAVSIQHLAASGTPTKPSTQSVVATLSFVSALPVT